MKNKEFENIRKKIIVRAWKDPRFKEKLLKDPHGALKEYSLNIPENIQIRCVQDTQNSFTFVLPTPPPASRELTEGELDKVAGGLNTLGECYL